MSGEEAWVAIQKKTFTKWLNNHMRKKGYDAFEDVYTEFDDGIRLMQVVNALYDLAIPKHNKNPKMRPQKADNLQQAFNMVEQAQIKTNFLKTTHLLDCDEKMILGMIWAIILDYAIKGISVDDLTAKEGLLIWCQKKTAGYNHVDPPTIKNFTKDWKNGLAFCALIHRHRPDLLNYDELDPANDESNLELAFSIGEEQLGIPRLLDVEDMTVEKPDERSVMTYVSEYFHRFASQDLKEKAAKRCARFIQMARAMQERKFDYEARAQALVDWTSSKVADFSGDDSLGENVEEAQETSNKLRQFILTEKPPQSAEKLDLETLFAEIQTELKVNNRAPYVPPEHLAPEKLQTAFENLWAAENAYGTLVRENRFRFVTKVEIKVADDKIQEFKDSFEHFDSNKSGHLCAAEFKAAAAALSVPFRDDDHALESFKKLCSGSVEEGISEDAFVAWMTELNEDRDTPEDMLINLKMLADDGATINEGQMNTPPLTEEDVAWMKANIPQTSEGQYDYQKFVADSFAQ